MTNQQRQPVGSSGLGRLDVLVGEWAVRLSVAGRTVGRGRSAFAWLDGGGALVEHADAEPATDFEPPPEWVTNAPFPVTTITGLDDATGEFTMLYADARGVSRVYRASLDEGVWRIWRDAPEFHQRFTGTFSGDRSVIDARWEFSADGSTWRTDFDLTYTRIS